MKRFEKFSRIIETSEKFSRLLETFEKFSEKFCENFLKIIA
jgi:hypothetical protein